MQILVPLHIYPDGNSANLAVHTGAVAQHLEAAVHALVLNVDFPPNHSPLADFILDATSIIAGAKQRCHENGVALLKAIGTEMEQRKIELHSSQVEYFPTTLTETVIDIARYHDLSILGIGQHDVALRGTAEEVLFGSGRPVLLVPEDLQAGSYTHVAVAWDGSRVAARAVTDAWSFLQRAASVTILCVSDEKPLPHHNIGSRLADYFAKT